MKFWEQKHKTIVKAMIKSYLILPAQAQNPANLTSLFRFGFAVPRKFSAIIQSGHLRYFNPTSNKGTDHPISQKQFHYDICLKIIALYHQGSNRPRHT